MKKYTLTLLIVLLMVGSLSACGRKGSLEMPQQSAIAMPEAATIS